MFRIVRAEPEAVEMALDADIFLPAVAVVGMDGGKIVGAGGLAWGNGQCWLWFKMQDRSARYAVAIVRETRRMLRRAVQLGESNVFTPRDHEEPMSEKLLNMVGFELHEIRDGIEIWKWSADRG